MLGDITQAHARNERRGVAEEAREAVGRGGGALRGLVGRGNADQGLRPVDAEPRGAQRREEQPDRRIGGKLPENENEERGPGHAEDARAVRAALQPFVGRPAREEHAQDAGDLEHRHEPPRVLHAHALRLAQKRRTPVKHREAHDVDEEVGKAQNPDQRVLEDVFHQEGAMLVALLLALDLFRLGALQFGKAHRRGGVAQEEHQSQRPGHRNARGDPEAPPPGPVVRGEVHHRGHALGIGGIDAQVGGDLRHRGGVAADVLAHVAHQVAAENHHKTRTDRVRGVPHRHLRGQLLGRDPVGQQPRARRESRTLQQAVDHPHHAHEEDHRVGELRAHVFARDPVGDVLAEAEGEVGKGAERQSDGHVPAGVHPVGEDAVDEARESVDQSVERQKDTEARLRDAEVRLQARHGQREVLAYEVEERVADHRREDRPRLPVLEALALFRCHFGMKELGFNGQRYNFRIE